MFHQVLPSKATTADYLQYVQRLNFTDKSIAYDSTGNAGTVAKVLGAVFGKSSLANKSYVGIGLSLVDKGMSYSSSTLAARFFAPNSTKTLEKSKS